MTVLDPPISHRFATIAAVGRAWMAEVNESTKVAVKLGSAFAVVVVLLGAGRYWGALDAQRDSTELRLSRNEKDISELRETFGKMSATLIEVNGTIQRIDTNLLDIKQRTSEQDAWIRTTREKLAERGWK